MKKTLCILIVLSVTAGLCGCAAETVTVSGTDTETEAGEKINVDLTEMSSTMVYSEVYNMTVCPDDYMGKTVKMRGSFAYAEGDGRYYFACVIADATACCSQGIEFILAYNRKFPEEYPQPGDEITVTGVFDTYYEGQNMYCQLINAELE